MREEKEFYDDIQKIFENFSDNINILEEQIDLDVQMSFFEMSQEIRKEEVQENYLDQEVTLFSADTDSELKKRILIGLAGTDDVKAYRMLEKFLQQADTGIRDWGILAFQESRMLLQTSLHDEQQFHISTGLGGKGKKLRYYLVFINTDKANMLTPIQQKLVKDELIFELKNANGEFESIDFAEGFSSALVLLPMHVDLKQLVDSVIEECNQYGDFLEGDMIITNVKVLSRNEILDIINKGDNLELPFGPDDAGGFEDFDEFETDDDDEEE